ncbi:hypothetical protein P7C70_g9065, partial [Phenoliferia sp. Uapishka_3]
SNMEYQVRWKGYGPSDDAWISACDANASALINAYWNANPPDLRVKVVLRKQIPLASSQSSTSHQLLSSTRGHHPLPKWSPMPGAQARNLGQELGLVREAVILEGREATNRFTGTSAPSASGSWSAGKAKVWNTGPPNQSRWGDTVDGKAMALRFEARRALSDGITDTIVSTATTNPPLPTAKPSSPFPPPPGQLWSSTAVGHAEKRCRTMDANLSTQAGPSDQPRSPLSAMMVVRLGEESKQDWWTQKKSKNNPEEVRRPCQSDGKTSGPEDAQHNGLDNCPSLPATKSDEGQVDANETKFARVANWEDLIHNIDSLRQIDGVCLISVEWTDGTLSLIPLSTARVRFPQKVGIPILEHQPPSSLNTSLSTASRILHRTQKPPAAW